MVGFYRSKYEDTDGNMKYMATTKFEPVSWVRVGIRGRVRMMT